MDVVTSAKLPASVDATLAMLGSADYIADRSLATAVHLALHLKRPLFLEGEAGVGKTEIAKVLATALQRRLIRLQCYEGLDVASAVYEWDYARQMIEIRLAEAAEDDRGEIESTIFSDRFLIKRPLLQALEPDVGGSPVLLIDELDRTDEPFEAYLLELLSDFQVTIPEIGTIRAQHPPIVIITSNRTREIHDALKRRCFYYWVDYPTATRELEILKRKAPNASEHLSKEVVGFVQKLRAMDLFKLPGIAETIDWTEALMQLDVLELGPQAINDTLGVLLKYQDDIARIQGSEAARLLDQIKAEAAAAAYRGTSKLPNRGDSPLSAPGGGEGRGEVGDDSTTSAGTHLTLPVASATGPLPLPPKAGGEGQGDGLLLANLMHFARTLRAAGLPVGPGKVIDAVQAVQAVGITDRRDFYWTLHAVFVNRPDQRLIFDQAFHVFWRNPDLLKKMMALVLPEMRVPGEEDRGAEMARRLAEALHPNRGEPAAEPEEVETEIDAVMTFSDREQLRSMDFDKMSLDELARAKAAIARLRLPVQDVPTRRFAPDRHGARADLRATLRAALRSGGLIELKRKSPRRRPPPLVVLCDISGSMSRYSRIFLHFMHTVTNDRDRVYTFVFGTRLTNITRYLRHRDVDLALERVGEAVSDWSGGTRIGLSIAEFNRLWSRRLLGQGAIVILITDGLDRDAGAGLAREMDRLHRSCRRLIWLNPLLRYEGFEPKSLGMRAMMPHVDEFRPVHNLASLEELIEVLSALPARRTPAAPALRHYRERAA